MSKRAVVSLSSSALFVASIAFAAFPSNVVAVDVAKGKQASMQGRLDDGTAMADLSWAAKSSMACFPATQNDKFKGPHKLFWTSIPARSEMTITLVPKDTSANLSLYAYELGTTSFAVPPEVSQAVSCEADYKWDRPKKGKTQDHTRSVKLTSIQNAYNVVIGVSGPAGAKGEFELKVDLK